MNDKRMRILMAAKQTFELNGYHETKMAEIAKKADVGKGTIYEYFDSKQMLFEEMMKFLLDSMYDYLLERVDQEDDCIKKLGIIKSLDIELARDHGKLFSVVLERMSTASDSLKYKFELSRVKELELIEIIIAEGMEKGVFKQMNAKYFSYIFKGAITQATMSERCGMVSKEEDILDGLFNNLIASIRS